MKERPSPIPAILPVLRTKEEAKRLYDRISGIYAYLSAFERKHAEMALECLSVEENETVLEIGFGSGHCLERIAKSVGERGGTYGIDISWGMLTATRKRLERAGLLNRTKLCCGDAATLPYGNEAFDAVFMSYTLELFDTPEIPKLLQETKRVLKPGGRLGVISMSKEDGDSLLLRLYEWAHRKWPKYLDCRPIFVEQSIRDAGYEIRRKEKVSLFGLPSEIVIAAKAPPSGQEPQEIRTQACLADNN